MHKPCEGGLIIKSIRMRVGITQKEMANLFGYGLNQVHLWECGKFSPKFETVIEIVEFYSLDLSTEIKRVREDDKHTASA